MKVITQKEFDSFPLINGYKQCPSGDYSKITLFKDRCTFGDNCLFGSFSIFIRKCLFGKKCIFGDDCNFIQLLIKNFLIFQSLFLVYLFLLLIYQ